QKHPRQRRVHDARQRAGHAGHNEIGYIEHNHARLVHSISESETDQSAHHQTRTENAAIPTSIQRKESCKGLRKKRENRVTYHYPSHIFIIGEEAVLDNGIELAVQNLLDRYIALSIQGRKNKYHHAECNPAKPDPVVRIANLHKPLLNDITDLCEIYGI